MGVSDGIDLSKLDVCFGGFSPTLMGDVFTSSQNMKEAQNRINEVRLARERAARLDAARESEEKTFIDDAGNTWIYVEVDSVEIKVAKCQPASGSIDIKVPASINDKPTVALGMDAMSYMKDVRSIDVPDSVISIGACAFRHCEKLERVKLPSKLGEFKSDWFRNCNALKDLALPGQLEVLKPNIFDIPNLKRLHIGQAAQSVEGGAFAKSRLESISISTDNPFMKTDGKAIYSLDGTIMAALAVPSESYSILEGCKALGAKSFSNMACVANVVFPESLEIIGNFALSKTGITCFHAPGNLKIIMEKAFFDCESLQNVELNEGLVAIERNAFTATAIKELVLPSTIEHLQFPFAARTDLVYAGSDATFRLDPNSEHITLDGAGGLYGNAEDGMHLIHMLDESTRSYCVQPGTVSVDEDAFASHPIIEEVVIAPSVRSIGAGAFKNCGELRKVRIEDGLESIGKDAFLNTSIESVFIPASLMDIGENAFVTRGSRHGGQAPTLHEVEVSSENDKFYVSGGLLLERKNERTSKAILCLDDRPCVVIPPEVDEIAPYAFNGSVNLKELVLSDRISTIGIRGLTVDSHLDIIHVDLVKPIDGHTSFELCFPNTTRGQQQQMLALSTSAFVNVESLFDHYDSSIVNASSFDAFNEEGLELYEQATRIIGRLHDPVFLSESNHAMCERILQKGIEQICVEIAKHDDRAAIDSLVDLGFLNEGNILKVIDRVGAVQDASMTGYLLEISRRLMGVGEMDFEL